MTTSTTRKLSRLVAETQLAEQSDGAAPAPRLTDLNPYLAGEVIGDRYRLQRELGQGGMGVVWVAHSLVLGVDVAVKLIRASAAGPAIASRMAREAHAAARLGHPALVRVFDFGWTNRGDPFLVMELVQGETLAALLSRESKIPAIRAVQTLLPIADGLRLAHDRSIIHRDIKPDNIFVATDTLGRAQPKLLDFGIAKVGTNISEGKLTQFGAVLGSPEYMSPEQALGLDDIDERTDVWSLCVVLYEIIAGTIPFRKANYNALMHAIINEDPKSTLTHGAGDEALWLVIERGLARERAQRWANMTELGEALALWLYEHGVKEDLSGNSIRAVWLDGALSGVRVEVTKSGPPLNGESKPKTPSEIRVGHLVSASAAARNGRQRRVNRGALGIALGTGVVAGGLIAAVALSSREKPEISQKPESSLAAAPPREPAPPAPRPTQEPEAAASTAPVAISSLPTAAATSTRSTAARAAVKPQPAVVAAPKRPAAKPKRSHDFGF